jgi:hypothetical protein
VHRLVGALPWLCSSTKVEPTAFAAGLSTARYFDQTESFLAAAVPGAAWLWQAARERFRTTGARRESEPAEFATSRATARLTSEPDLRFAIVSLGKSPISERISAHVDSREVREGVARRLLDARVL